jgi:hypothetical protein
MKRRIGIVLVALAGITAWGLSVDFDAHIHMDKTTMVKHGVTMQYLPPPPGLLTVQMPPEVEGGQCVEALWVHSTTNQHIQVPVHREIREDKLTIVLWADTATLRRSHLQVKFQPTNSIHGTVFHFDFKKLVKKKE